MDFLNIIYSPPDEFKDPIAPIDEPSPDLWSDLQELLGLAPATSVEETSLVNLEGPPVEFRDQQQSSETPSDFSLGDMIGDCDGRISPTDLLGDLPVQLLPLLSPIDWGEVLGSPVNQSGRGRKRLATGKAPASKKVGACCEFISVKIFFF